MMWQFQSVEREPQDVDVLMIKRWAGERVDCHSWEILATICICLFASLCVCVCMCVHATMEEAMGPKGAKRQKLTKWLTRLTACHTHTYPHTSSYTHNSQPCCGVFVFTLFCESCFRFPTRLETSAKNVSHIVNYFERKMMMMSVPAEIVIYEWQNIHRSAVPFAFRLLPACHGLFVKYDLIYWVWPP